MNLVLDRRKGRKAAHRSGDLVRCISCEKLMLVNNGENRCPECKRNGVLMWADPTCRYNTKTLKRNGYRLKREVAV